MTNKELGAAIRNNLKSAGIPARSVSVTVKDAGYSTSVRVRIKDISIGRKFVENIVNSFRDVSYDIASGEILEGANTYTHVEYDYDAMDQERAKHIETAREIIANHPGHGSGIEIAHNEKTGTHATFFFEINGNGRNMVTVFDENKDRPAYELGRYYVHGEGDLAAALALFTAHGSFVA